jgi:hypothetical protein
MKRSILAALVALSALGCGGKTYNASCGAGGPDCGGTGTCNLGTAWGAKSCLVGDKCVDAAKGLCEQVASPK